MTSSPTREVDPDMLSAVLADHDERRPCPTPCRDQSERGGCLCAITAATIRALLARAEAAERERDNWKRRAEDMHRRVTAAEGCAYNRWMRDQRDAARAEAARLREDLNDVGRICTAIIGENKRLLRTIGLNADYAQVPRDLVCKHAVVLAGETGHDR